MFVEPEVLMFPVLERYPIDCSGRFVHPLSQEGTEDEDLFDGLAAASG